ncbi:MAG TPA: nitrite reductase (NAD(P)H) small subunit [Aggregatilineaceae bacterium]|nr:nitrite reductase (NAD(P)H) small subunit [Aggregatilineaceae bacterium]
MAVVSAPEGYEFICTLSDLPKRGKKSFHIGKSTILIIVCESGLYALEDRCPMTARSMAHGKVLNDEITSPNTGARYSLKTGFYVGGGQSPLQSHWLPLLRLKVEHDQVYVRLPRIK